MTTTPPPIPPVEKPNVNLERVLGGSPGFINISRYMCVGSYDDNPTGGIDEAQAITSRSGEYTYACGYYHDGVGRNASNTVGSTTLPAVDDPSYHKITDTFNHDGNDDGCGGQGVGEGGGWGGSIHEYIERSTNELRKVRMKNKHALIPGGFIENPSVGRTIANNNALKVRTAFVFKHPRMEVDELKYFGIPAEDRLKVQSVAAGENVNIFGFSCSHGQRGTLSVAFFKKDLTTIVAGDKKVPDPSGSGRSLHQYKIISKITPTAGIDQHDSRTLNYYTFAVMVWSNGGNKGCEPISQLSVTSVLQVPEAPFWDDDTIMVVMIGPNGNGGRKNKATTVTSIRQSGTHNWFQGPVGNNFPLFTQESDASHINCRISYSISRFTETFFGCSQLRDVDWQLNSNGTVSGNDQLWNVPESGRHVMKLVSSDYYERDCTNRISSSVVIDQDSVVYSANCKDNIGDPRTPTDITNPDAARTGKESLNGKHHIEKCMSYSMNVNPTDTRINSSKCCSPKISGPFLLDSRKNKKRTGINEKIYDVPYTRENELGNRPDLSMFNDNFRYQLRNRIDCECNSSNCDVNPCYSCLSNNKDEYDACRTRTTCTENNCCVNPCQGCPLDYEQCTQNTECASKGCCSLCSGCDVTTAEQYQNCIDNVGIYGTKNCKDKNCCIFPCTSCPTNFSDCILNPECVANGCCSANCGDCLTDNVLEYFSCVTNTNIFGVTKYKEDYESYCCKNSCCESDCSGENNITLTYNECITNTECLKSKCHLIKTNPNYKPNNSSNTNFITWGRGDDIDAIGSGVALEGLINGLGNRGTYKGVEMTSYAAGGLAPLLPDYKVGTGYGGTPWCTGSCKPLMLRGSDVTDQELINIFGIPSSNVSDVKYVIPGSTYKITANGYYANHFEILYFVWNTDEGVIGYEEVDTGKKIITIINPDGNGVPTVRIPFIIIEQEFSLPKYEDELIPTLKSNQVLVIAVHDGRGSHDVSVGLTVTNPTSSVTCVSNTVDQYITCLQNSGCHNLSSTTNINCNFPCGDVNTPNSCAKNIFTLRTIAGEQRYIETYNECKTILPSCDISGCCAFFFPEPCTGT